MLLMYGLGINNSAHCSKAQPKIGISIILLMFVSILTPLACAQNIEYAATGAPLSENPDDAPITY